MKRVVIGKFRVGRVKGKPVSIEFDLLRVYVLHVKGMAERGIRSDDDNFFDDKVRRRLHLSLQTDAVVYAYKKAGFGDVSDAVEDALSERGGGEFENVCADVAEQSNGYVLEHIKSTGNPGGYAKESPKVCSCGEMLYVKARKKNALWLACRRGCASFWWTPKMHHNPGVRDVGGEQVKKGFVVGAVARGKLSSKVASEYNKAKVPGVLVELEDYTDIEVEIAYIEAKERGKGRGTLALQRIIEVAEKVGVSSLMLLPVGKPGEERFERLAAFYEKFGFYDDGGQGVYRLRLRRTPKMHHNPGGKIPKEEMFTGFIDPVGKFYPIPMYMHGEWARKYLSRQSMPTKDEAVDELLSDGWVRISGDLSDDQTLAFDWRGGPWPSAVVRDTMQAVMGRVGKAYDKVEFILEGEGVHDGYIWFAWADFVKSGDGFEEFAKGVRNNPPTMRITLRPSQPLIHNNRVAKDGGIYPEAVREGWLDKKGVFWPLERGERHYQAMLKLMYADRGLTVPMEDGDDEDATEVFNIVLQGRRDGYIRIGTQGSSYIIFDWRYGPGFTNEQVEVLEDLLSRYRGTVVVDAGGDVSVHYHFSPSDWSESGEDLGYFLTHHNPSEYAKERKEHPTLPASAIKQIVKDHAMKNPRLAGVVYDKDGHPKTWEKPLAVPKRLKGEFHVLPDDGTKFETGVADMHTGQHQTTETMGVRFRVRQNPPCAGEEFLLNPVDGTPFNLKWTTKNVKLLKTLTLCFSLPRGIPKGCGKGGLKQYETPHGTCPGAGACVFFCYAKGGNFSYPDVKASRLHNLTASKRADFQTKLTEDLTRIFRDGIIFSGTLNSGEKVSVRTSPRSVRIHDEGDFYSQKYVNDWAAVIKKFPQARWYAYTKSFKLFSFKAMPPQFRMVQSMGGIHDRLMDPKKPVAKVFGLRNEKDKRPVLERYYEAVDQMKKTSWVYGSYVDLPAFEKCPLGIGLMAHGTLTGASGEFHKKTGGDKAEADAIHESVAMSTWPQALLTEYVKFSGMLHKNPRELCVYCKGADYPKSWTEDGKPVCGRCTAEWARDEFASVTLFESEKAAGDARIRRAAKGYYDNGSHGKRSLRRERGVVKARTTVECPRCGGAGGEQLEDGWMPCYSCSTAGRITKVEAHRRETEACKDCGGAGGSNRDTGEGYDAWYNCRTCKGTGTDQKYWAEKGWKNPAWRCPHCGKDFKSHAPTGDCPTMSEAELARRAWKGKGGMQGALSQYRRRHPGEHSGRLSEVFKERPDMKNPRPHRFRPIASFGGALLRMELVAKARAGDLDPLAQRFYGTRFKNLQPDEKGVLAKMIREEKGVSFSEGPLRHIGPEDLRIDNPSRGRRVVRRERGRMAARYGDYSRRMLAGSQEDARRSLGRLAETDPEAAAEQYGAMAEDHLLMLAEMDPQERAQYLRRHRRPNPPEMSSRPEPKLYRAALERVLSKETDANTRDYRKGLIESMDPKRLSMADREMLTDIIRMYDPHRADNPLDGAEALALVMAGESQELVASKMRPGHKERVFRSGLAAGHGIAAEVYADSPSLRRRGATLRDRAARTGKTVVSSRKVAKNPGGGRVRIGRKCIGITTTSGTLSGRMGAVYGNPNGSVTIQGVFPSALKGKVKAVMYMDEAKAKREGMKNPNVPWKHDFSSEDVTMQRCRGGIRLTGKRPLWGMR